MPTTTFVRMAADAQQVATARIDAVTRAAAALQDEAAIRMIQRAHWARPRNIARANPRARVRRSGRREVEIALEHGPFYGSRVTETQASPQFAVIHPVLLQMRQRLLGILLGRDR